MSCCGHSCRYISPPKKPKFKTLPLRMKLFFLVLSAVITIAAVVPYIRDMVGGRTKPNIVSWFTWTLLAGTATAAEIAGGEYVAAIFTSAATLEVALVVALGLKFGYVKYSRFDGVCQ